MTPKTDHNNSKMCGRSKESRTRGGFNVKRDGGRYQTQRQTERGREGEGGKQKQAEAERLMHCHVLYDHPLVYTLLNSNRV